MSRPAGGADGEARRLSDRRQAASLLVVGLPGPELTADDARWLSELRPGGVILLPPNITSAAPLAALVAAVRRAAPEALLFLDAEGGRVDRLRRLVGPAPAAAWLAPRPPRLARRAGRWIGQSLAAFGFDVDLAPVVDLDHGERDNALDERYLGATPRAVIARARAFLGGLHGAGVGGCLKHFPGLGAARRDTHFTGAGIELSAVRLRRDLEPFRRLAAAAGAVMASHAAYPALDPEGRPATLSPPVATRLLRRELGFAGPLFSDDLDMEALAPWGPPAERPEAALAAGCDLLFLCRSPLAVAADAVERLAVPELAARRRLAARRVGAYRRQLAALAAAAPRHSLAVIRRRLEELRRVA